MNYKRILVTGTARSGTKYTAELLSQLSGLPVSHEEIFGLYEKTADDPEARKDLDPFGDPPPWGEHRICVSWLSAPFLDRLPSDVLTIHQVRHPIKTISSIYRRKFLKQGNPYGEFAVRALDGFPGVNAWPVWPTNLESACEYWVRWTDMIANSRTQLWWRVEDLDACHWILEPLLEHVVGEIRQPIPHRERLEVPTDLNSGVPDGRSRPESLSDIPEKWRAQVWSLGRKFGYEL